MHSVGKLFCTEMEWFLLQFLRIFKFCNWHFHIYMVLLGSSNYVKYNVNSNIVHSNFVKKLILFKNLTAAQNVFSICEM